MTRLSPVLTPLDLPLAELCAARLDGQLFRLDDCFVPIDEPHTIAHRALAIGSQWPGKLIAERHTAAWVWGTLASPPPVHELCVSLGARARPPSAARLNVREVVIDDDEYVEISGVKVTDPLRTLIDLARWGRDDATIAPVLAAIARYGGIRESDCTTALERRRNLPNKTTAWRRIAALRLDD